LCVGSFATPFVPNAQRGPVEHFLGGVLVTLLIPFVVHLVAQEECKNVPETHGQRLVGASFSIWLLGGMSGTLCLPNWSPLAIVFFGLLFVSFGLWLIFFARLGAALRDRALRVEARTCLRAYAFGAVQVAVLLVGARLVASESPVAAGFFRLVASGLVLLFLWRYAALTRTAALAVARCAPVGRDG
jgi:hypothetical protein